MKISSSYLRFFIRYVRPHWGKNLLLLLMMLINTGLQLLNPQILAYFIDTLIHHGFQISLLYAALLYTASFLLGIIASIGIAYLTQHIAWTITNTVRIDVVAHCVHLDMGFHQKHTAGALTERIDGDADGLSQFFSQFLVNLVSSCMLLVGVLSMMFKQDWRAGALMLLYTSIALFLMIRVSAYAKPHWRATRQVSTDFYGFLTEYLSGIESIRANGAGNHVRYKFYQLLRQWFPINQKRASYSALVVIANILIFGSGRLLGLLIGGYLWSIGAVSVGIAYTFYHYADLIARPIDQLQGHLQDLPRVGVNIERIDEFTQQSSSVPNTGTAHIPPEAPTIAFNSISFHYPNTDTVLHNLSFQLPAGQSLGIVGRTGSGKTTIARLLARFYDPQQGEILLNDIPLQNLSLPSLRQSIAVITQDVQLFQASVRDNLTIFNPSILDEAILTAVHEVGLAPWLKSLPQGLDTELGSDGQGLSAGEAQLLAFARAFLIHPKLVILDEASSRLDQASEQLIKSATQKILTNRTGVIIAHRLSTLNEVDKILVLENGTMLECDDRNKLITNPSSHFSILLQEGLQESLS